MFKQFFSFLTALLISCNLFSQPIINSLSPLSGPVGTVVHIKGAGFKDVSSQNTVYFGAVKAVVQNATDTALTVAVPTGATFQPVTVTTDNLTAYSLNSFIVTYPGGKGSFTNASFLPKVNLFTGIYPHSVALSDFNEDGKADLLVSKGSSSNVSVFANTSREGTISFGQPIELQGLGLSHEGCATGDLDGDGKTDLVIANSRTTASVSVYRNTTSGQAISFAPKIDYDTDNGPYSVAIGDINGDGKPDLIVANNGSNVVSFYKNTGSPGNISFAARVDFEAGTNPYGVAISDLDGDGKTDIAVTTQGTSSALLIMKNTSENGIVSFETPKDYATFGGPFVVSIGDLDGDSIPDLVAASSFSNSVVVLKNVSIPGKLSFYSSNFTTGTYPVCVSMGDIDGDGKPDLISSNEFSNSISVLRNISTSNNIAFEPHTDYPTESNPLFMTIGDLDGDGRPDIVAANSSSDVVSVFRNIIGTNVVPTINSFTPQSGIKGTAITIKGTNFSNVTSVKFGGVEAASFKVDSITGITAIVNEGNSGDVTVTTTKGTASLGGFSFNGPIINSFTPSTGITGTEVTIQGSNFSDVSEVKFGGTSAASYTVISTNTIKATLGSGASGAASVTTSFGTASLDGFTFGAPIITSITPEFGHMGDTVTINGANFDNNPNSNIVFFGAARTTVSSASSTELKVIVPPGATYQPVTVTTNQLTAYSSKPFMETFEGDGKPLSASSFSLLGNYGVGIYPVSIAISDLDNDNKTDIITVNGVSNSLTILRNTSNTETVSFNTKIDYPTGTGPRSIAIGDLDGDGKPDLVVNNFNSGNASIVSVFRNTSSEGNISFAPKKDYNTGNGSLGIAVADMNGDGKPDWIVTSGNSGFFSFFKNTSSTAGSISFALKQDYTLMTHPDNITIADVNMDGRPDLITSNFSDGTISIFRNNSFGGALFFDGRIDLPAGSNPTNITTGDMDGDGKIDIILSNYSSGDILFYRNLSENSGISFAPGQSLTEEVSNIAVADLNGDSKLDLFAGHRTNGKASILQNISNGAGNILFTPGLDFTTGSYTTSVSVGDLDGNGKPELIIANTTSNSVSIFKNIVGKPVITDISSTKGSSETLITINGSNFKEITSVTFGGTPASSFTVNSENQIVAIVGGGASGDIIVTNATGSGKISGFRFIPTISRNGPLTFCNDKTVILTSSALHNNQWYRDGKAIEGAVANTFEVNMSGTYSVQTTSNGVTTSAYTSVVANVITVPTPDITKETGSILVSSASTGNQWYLNEHLIPGAVDKSYLPTTVGSYTVRNISNGCTSDFSASYNFALTGVINLGNGQYINLYPNPVNDQLNLNWNINEMPLLNVQIIDMQGNQLFMKGNLQSGTSINLSQLSKGMLLLRIFSDDGKINEATKFIKQ
jgi:hypothetical protein